MAKSKNPAPDPDDATLTVRDVARLLRVKPRTVLRLVERKLFPPPLRLSQRLLRWRLAAVAAFLREREGGAA